MEDNICSFCFILPIKLIKPFSLPFLQNILHIFNLVLVFTLGALSSWWLQYRVPGLCLAVITAQILQLWFCHYFYSSNNLFFNLYLSFLCVWYVLSLTLLILVSRFFDFSHCLHNRWLNSHNLNFMFHALILILFNILKNKFTIFLNQNLSQNLL